MAQLSLYLDSETYGKVESAANTSGKSISKYVSEIIHDYFTAEWPANYSKLFGSISDDSFFPNGAEKITKETVRESL
ncbi:MAG: hypothetical protein FWD78_12980 [Treponema sp.]|nr:hypothetical protein [Treponema sp.]